jgi:hypothetical protein
MRQHNVAKPALCRISPYFPQYTRIRVRAFDYGKRRVAAPIAAVPVAASAPGCGGELVLELIAPFAARRPQLCRAFCARINEI